MPHNFGHDRARNYGARARRRWCLVFGPAAAADRFKSCQRLGPPSPLHPPPPLPNLASSALCPNRLRACLLWCRRGSPACAEVPVAPPSGGATDAAPTLAGTAALYSFAGGAGEAASLLPPHPAPAASAPTPGAALLAARLRTAAAMGLVGVPTTPRSAAAAPVVAGASPRRPSASFSGGGGALPARVLGEALPAARRHSDAAASAVAAAVSAVSPPGATIGRRAAASTGRPAEAVLVAADVP
ncbi:hypothetical protein BU14_0354s0005 [Porphyra umbilicalis]|uniref:Uncharacterized protein n=1 Tax=Porphyra umbilicalis TaxID=2786 RepID=A0A1X6NXX9_PORUM|nr:hypothetical protein BU14_0354s0005 [Porphyra umbilicalis]|eukprot:OSX73356.1 hypothetical protein BU14_0354s0005 [Porphyra umbilicalis]